MAKILNNIRRVGILGIMLMLAACTALSPATALPTPQPTADIHQMSTEVAATVLAQLTAEAAVNLTETSAALPAPTLTVQPSLTNTAIPLLTPTVLPSFTPTRVLSGGGVYLPTRTPYTDAAELVSQTPPDGFRVSKGQDFDILWTVKNVGLRDWNNQFYLRYLSGVEGSDANEIMVANTVPVHETYTFRVDMVAPVTPGRYVTTWQLINDDGVAILTLNLVFYSTQ